MAALVAHPDAVRSALAVAGDVLRLDDAGQRALETIGGAEPRLVDAEKAAGRLATRTRENSVETLQTSDELAVRGRTQDAPVGSTTG